MINEIEIKIKIEKSDNIEAKLLELKGIPGEPYEQKTYGFFSEDSIKKGIFPRIRNEGSDLVLTVKVRPDKKSEYFERKEYSTTISNLDDAISILKIFGYNNIEIFEKTRQEWKFENVLITLDKLYFGTFLEIEGPKKDIEGMVDKLGFRNKERITKAYLALEEDYKDKSDLGSK